MDEIKHRQKFTRREWTQKTIDALLGAMEVIDKNDKDRITKSRMETVARTTRKTAWMEPIRNPAIVDSSKRAPALDELLRWRPQPGYQRGCRIVAGEAHSEEVAFRIDAAGPFENLRSQPER